MALYQKYTGVILKKFPVNEADELLTIYTKEQGKLRAVARGVRKIKSRLAGSLDSLNEIEFELARQVIISARLVTLNDYLREDLKKFAYASMGVETLYRLTGDGQENVEGYQCLIKFLKNLGETNQENLAVRIFQLQLLACCGFRFPLEEPNLTGEVREQLAALSAGGAVKNLRREVEAEIDQFLDYVLEREIKSKKFIDSIK